ncbi:MAG TPA: bifunctional DNA primase/polymerase [Pseudonocardiaceae bacterium]|nr:bifunctional DNA primase/polymerase [Pseudonocardiaceae bacterium]
MTTTRLDWALRLAARGWPVFPVVPAGKQPAWPLHSDTPDRPCPRAGRCRAGHQGWEQLATTDPGRITAHWARHDDHNIGLATGPAGLVVLDLDVARPGKHLPEDCVSVGAIHGAQMLGQLANEVGESVPATWTVATPSGGTHLYFLAPTGQEAPQLHSTRNRLAGLIDTRAIGGYVVAPGSTTPEGGYEVVDDRAPASLPGWLVQRLADRPSTAISAPRQIAADNINPYVARAIEGETQRVTTAPGGGHNHAQRSAGAALGELVGADVLDYDLAHAQLMQAAAGHITGTCHCTQRGVSAVFHSALRYGMRNPRRLTSSVDRSAA